MVNPGELLNPRVNKHLTGRWIIVQGMAKVTVGERTVTLKDDESVIIPYGERHELENVGRNPLEIIEVQVGRYLAEDDTVRFEDRYESD